MTVTLNQNAEAIPSTPLYELFIDWEAGSMRRPVRRSKRLTRPPARHSPESPEGDAEDVDRAVRAARRAFEEGPPGRMTLFKRGRIDPRIGDLIVQHND